MSYGNCPICLEEFTSAARLAWLCLDHKGEQGELFIDQIVSKQQLCGHCSDNGSVQGGVLLAHIDCEFLNPFTKRDVKGNLTLKLPEDYILEGRDGGPARKVDHWVLGALEAAASRCPKVMAKWFPRRILSATRGEGVLIKLSGAPNVGKTLLSTMALYRANYQRAGRQSRFQEVEDFLYVKPNHDAEEPASAFLESVYPVGLLNSFERDARWAMPTERGMVNLKAVIFRRSEAQPTAYSPRKGLFRLRQRSRQSAPAQRTSVLFYDVAGEDVEAMRHVEMYHIDRRAGVVLQLVDVTELSWFGGGHVRGKTSLAVAAQRLNSAIGGHSRQCVVVTKLDRVLQHDGMKMMDRDYLFALSEGERELSRLPDQFRDRELLQRWLTYPGSLDSERSLWRLIEERRAEVAFVWTELLDSGVVGELPRSVGLVRLIEWCLAPGGV